MPRILQNNELKQKLLLDFWPNAWKIKECLIIIPTLTICLKYETVLIQVTMLCHIINLEL